jgi:hypothetical protein
MTKLNPIANAYYRLTLWVWPPRRLEMTPTGQIVIVPKTRHG